MTDQNCSQLRTANCELRIALLWLLSAFLVLTAWLVAPDAARADSFCADSDRATNPANQHQYCLTTAAPWDEAQAQAQIAGGNLVAINDQDEQDWLFANFTSSEVFWLGLSDTASEGDFVWVNGDPLSYTNWLAGEPNNFNRNEDYAALGRYVDGQWFDDTGTVQYPGIVEIASAPSVVTSENTPPVATDDAFTTTGSDYSFTAADLLANDSDADDDPLAIASLYDVRGGTLTAIGDDYVLTLTEDDISISYVTDGQSSGASGNYTFTLSDINEPGSFKYTLSDGNGGNDTAMVTVRHIAPPSEPSLKIVTGSTPSGQTAWEQYGAKGLTLLVDTSEAGFTQTPLYFTSIDGDSNHWLLAGVNAIYSAQPDSFRVYVLYRGGALSSVTPEVANQKHWHLNWTAIGEN